MEKQYERKPQQDSLRYNILKYGDILVSEKIKYKIIKEIGTGSYGNVFQIKHKYTNLAVKIIKNDRNYKKDALKEIQIIKSLNSPYIVKYLSHFNFKDFLCILQKLYHINLYKYTVNELFIKHIDVCTILINISYGLDYLKSKKIIHRDLKPENIFFKSDKNLDLVIGDFGLSTSLDILPNEADGVKFNVQSMWYRAPEICLKIRNYNTQLDIWSLGCISYELYWRTPLFKFNTNIKLFISHNIKLNYPPIDFIKNNPQIHTFYDDRFNPNYLIKDNFEKTTFKHKQFVTNHSNNMELIQFVIKCCSWEMEHRYTPKECIDYLKLIKYNE